eukprot:TRINITY_DN2982_c0_g1_i8.p1 TRINITY_DN2982_c0_g1~~TRINITY_DN2982_c0_g1_i8.p1  ORF type:complete len:671 (+),score=168.61 TRINITY_DN2982_c0_g1_i8:229-2241(+)
MNDTKTVTTTVITSTEAILIPAGTLNQQQKTFSGSGALENIGVPNPPPLPHFRKARPSSFKLRTRNWRTIPPGKRSSNSQWWEPERLSSDNWWKTGAFIPSAPPAPQFSQRSASAWNRRLRTRSWDFSNSELGWSGIDRLSFFTTIQQLEERQFQCLRECYFAQKSSSVGKVNGIPNPPPLPNFNLQQNQHQQRQKRFSLHKQKVNSKLRRLRTKTWGRWNAHQQIQEIENRRYVILKELYLSEKVQKSQQQQQFAASSNVQETSLSSASIRSAPSSSVATATHVAPIEISPGQIYTSTSDTYSTGFVQQPPVQQQQINNTQAGTFQTTTIQQTSAPVQYTANKVSTYEQQSFVAPVQQLQQQPVIAPVQQQQQQQTFVSPIQQQQPIAAPVQSAVVGSNNIPYYDSKAPTAPTVPGTVLAQPSQPAIVGQPPANSQTYIPGTTLLAPNNAQQQTQIQQTQQTQQIQRGQQSVTFAQDPVATTRTYIDPKYNPYDQNQTGNSSGKGLSNTFAKVTNVAKSALRKKKQSRPASQQMLYSTSTTQSTAAPVQSAPVAGYTAPTVITPGSSVSGVYPQQQGLQQQGLQQQPISTTTYSTPISPTGTTTTSTKKKNASVMKFKGLFQEKIGHITHNPQMEMQGRQLENEAVIAKQTQQQQQQLSSATSTGTATF